MKAVLATLLLLLCIGSIYATDRANGNCNQCTCKGITGYWHASLLPAEEVPPVNSSATAIGSLIVSLEQSSPAPSTGNATTAGNQTDNLALRYHLFLKGNNFIAAHIHVGTRCVAGPVVAFLAGPFTGNGTSLPNGGLLAEGVLTSANLTGPLAGFTILDLVQEIRAGNAYVNAHTVTFPNGETRGQLQPLQEDSLVASDLLNATLCTGKFDSFLQLVASNITGNTTNSDALFQSALRNSSLAGSGPFTVFAPTDAFWAAVNQSAITNTSTFLAQHVVSGAFTFSEFLGRVTILPTLAGTTLTIDGVQPNSTSTSLLLKAANLPRVTVNGVLISDPDVIIASNGVVQGLAGPLPTNTTVTATTTTTSARRFRQFRRRYVN